VTATGRGPTDAVSPSVQPVPIWPPGGGEMGALMRATDWSRTPLGPTETWPASLRTMVGVVLASRFPMLMGWGPDLLHLYNDASRAILRDKHPWALAAPAARVWAEMWDVVGPLARGVLAGGASTWSEDHRLLIQRDGQPTEAYFTFSFSAVPDDHGGVGGVLNAVRESTDTVQAERHQRVLHDVATRTVGATSEREAAAIAAAALAADELDLPFVLVYRRDAAAADAELIASGGWRGQAPPPARVADAGPQAIVPLAEAASRGRAVVFTDLAARFGPITAGAAGVPTRAMVLPLARPGEARATAFLVVGLSPHRHLDDRYRQLLDDAAAEVAQAMTQAARFAANVDLARQLDGFHRFFRMSLDMMCIAGVDGYFRQVNPAFLGLGWTEHELTSRPFLDFVHPDDVAATVAEVVALGQNVPTIHFENRYRCADGSYRWLSWTTAPDGHGTLYAIARDVTHTRQIQDALQEAKDAALAANHELESFSYSVAHDLRGPLRSIDGFSQAVLEDYADRLDADGQRYLGYVRESAQQMAQLIDDLLALSRVSRSELHRTRVDLGALARATLTRLQRAQPDRAVEVVIADDLHAAGDPRLLAVVLDNLLGNAWKFTRGRADPRIEVGVTRAGDRPVYVVRDNGAGFDMAFVGKLFGVFQRLHAASEFEGTGVGLATVQRVIARHGGKVWAEGEVGVGATFFFTLAGGAGELLDGLAGESDATS